MFRLVPFVVLLALFVLAGCSDLGKPILLRPVADLSADTLDFGVVSPGNTEERTLLVGNHGDGVLRASASIACAPYAIVSGGGAFEVAPGAVHTIVVRFVPTAPGPVPCTLQLGEGLPAVMLQGSGAQPVATPGCTISTGVLDYGSVDVGQIGSRTLRVHSTGTAPLALQAQSSSAAFVVAIGDGPHTLAPGDSLEITVNFVPTAAGPIEATLSFGPNCPTVTLRGTGAVFALCRLSTNALDYGPVAVGSSGSYTMRVRNFGNGPMTVNPTTSCAAYTVTSGAGPFTVAPQESLAITVRFAPTAGGRQACTLSIGPDCATVALTGDGTTVSLAADVAPTLIRYNCGNCHAYATASDLVKVAAGGYGGATLVEPYDPTHSVVYAKIANLRTYGGVMPPGGTGMSTTDRAKWFNWILEGAHDN
jgi:hypothetical protein